MKAKLPVLLFILLLSIALRLYNIGRVPVSLDWDEVSLGYNAYSLLETGRDEYGNSWPFSIRSFNDYKPPLYTYLTIPSVYIFGLTEVAVRLPSAILGILAVGLSYLLTKEIFQGHRRQDTLALLASFLLAISPWHLQFSRAAFEANSALTFYIATIYLFLRWFRRQTDRGNLWLIAAAITASITMYAYHSARLALPILLVGIALLKYKIMLKRWRGVIPAIVVGAILVFPFVYTTFFRTTSLSRFNTVSFLANTSEFAREAERFERNREYAALGGVNKLFHHRYLVSASVFLRNYTEHFNLDFLFIKSDGNPRHSIWGMGLLYFFSFPFMVVGIISLINDKQSKNKSVVWLWLLVGPVASALTESTPHAIRSFLLLPGFQILTALGLYQAYQKLTSLKLQPVITKGIVVSICLVCLVNVFYYLNSYYVVSPYYYSKDWQYGYKQLVNRLSQIEENYDQVIVTTAYDQPHIYFAFYQKIDPRVYQEFAETASNGFGKYEFKSVDVDTDYDKEKTLVVADPRNTPGHLEILEQIKFLNGDVAFNLIENKDLK